MINLAGHKNADNIILEELFVAGIEPVEVPRYGEPNTIWSGRLLNFTFRRAWYYWVVNGKVSLPLAIKMYEQQPYGRRDVRAAGHCGCPHPLEVAEYVDSDGIILCSRLGKDGKLSSTAVAFQTYADGTMDGVIRQALESQNFLKKYRIVDDKTVGFGYVDQYHIDSQAGLKVFVDAVTGK